MKTKIRSFWVSISMIFLKAPSEAFNFCFFLFPSLYFFSVLSLDGMGLVRLACGMGVCLFVLTWIGLLRFM